jgi:hypothetical protein
MRLSLIAAALGLALAATGADAQYGHRGPYHGDFVVAESWYGKGVVTGAVRPGRTGWQVRLPLGTWIDCVRSCADTLRRQTVDFWESNGPQSRDGGSPGYFRWHFRY